MKKQTMSKAAGSLLVLALLLLGQTASTHAQAAISIKQAVLSQTLASEDLIVGKDMVVIITLNLNNTAPVSLKATAIFENRSYEATKNVSSSDNYIAVTVPGGPSRAASYTANVKIETQGASNTGSNTQVTTPEKKAILMKATKIKIFFLPVDWTDSNRSRYNFDREIPKMARENFEFIKATYPLPSSAFEYDYADAPYNLRPFESTVADDNGEINWTAITAMYASVGVVGRNTVGHSGKTMPDATIVVGVLPPKWFADHMKSPTTAGLEITSIKGTVTSAILNYIAVAGHEMGHTYGLLDDYDASKNKVGNPLDDNGYWVNMPNNDNSLPDLKGRPALIQSNFKDADGEPYYGFMAAVNDNPWVDSATWRFIRDAINK